MKAVLKRSRVSMLVCAALSAGLLVSNGLQAAGPGTAMTGNAKISGTCKITTAPGTLDFGTIDPSLGANATATTTFVMKCSNGTTSTAATDNNGLFFSVTKRMQHSVTATAFLPYAIAYVNDVGFVGAGFAPAAASQTVT